MGCASEDDGRSLEYFSAAAWTGQTAVDLETEFLVCTYTQQTGLKGLLLLKRFPIVDLSTGRMFGSVVAEILGHLGGVASQRVIRTGKGIVGPDAVGEKGGAVEREEVGLGGLPGHQHQGVEVTPIVQNDGHQVIRGDAVPHAMLVR